ncbi:Clathrin-coated vesicle protein [Mycena sanguinolenta]|uniref:Clathrin-coated vesicle protein n=1 Tax=Mycena sanguinolenta TaxID=230812 RepID=A0A8H6YWP5_9AGAR|nr:Clathrin-coated vesicle protein [Mycena sanguinolenta]
MLTPTPTRTHICTRQCTRPPFPSAPKIFSSHLRTAGDRVGRYLAGRRHPLVQPCMIWKSPCHTHHQHVALVKKSASGNESRMCSLHSDGDKYVPGQTSRHRRSIIDAAAAIAVPDITSHHDHDTSLPHDSHTITAFSVIGDLMKVFGSQVRQNVLSLCGSEVQIVYVFHGRNHHDSSEDVEILKSAPSASSQPSTSSADPHLCPAPLPPTEAVLVTALCEVAGLLRQLGNAPPPVQDTVAEPLVTLSHPSHTVRVNTAWALRCFCFSTPLHLPKTILTVMELLQRDLASLLTPSAPADVSLRALGHAYGLAALVSAIPA